VYFCFEENQVLLMINAQLEPFLQDFNILFRDNQINKAYLFGSAVTDNFNTDSDLDLIITFQPQVTDPLTKGDLMWKLQFAIEDLTKRKVDIFQESSLKNPYFIKEVNETKELIYG